MPIGDFPVEGKVVLITGGGSGIGLAFTQLCLQKGAKVIIADLKLTKPAEVLSKQHPQSLFFTACDVSHWNQLHTLPDFAIKSTGTVPDIWIMNAGIYEPAWSNFWDDTEDAQEHYATVSINVEHPIKLTRIAIRSLLGRNKKGVVLCVASMSGLRSKFGSVLYCATKHAIVGFVKGLGLLEEAEGIKVVAICPGRVHTPLWTGRDDLETNFNYVEADSATPEEMAWEMLKLVQEGRFGGGTVYRAEKGGGEVAIEGIGEEDVKERMELPETKRVQGILSKERGVASR